MGITQRLWILLRTPGFSAFVAHFGYVGILLWFLTFDQLTAIPEEVSLLIVGYLSAHHVFHPVIAGVLCLLAFSLWIQSISFSLKKESSWIKKKTRGSFSVMKSLRNKLEKNTFKAIFILCFIPRMRMFAPILAGSMNLSYRRFLLCDSIALTFFTTIYLLIGLIFNRSLQKMIKQAKGIQNIVFFATLLVIGVVIVLFIRSRKKKVLNTP